MELIVCKDEIAWVESINTWLSINIERYNISRVFLPAGDTPRPLYKFWESRGAPFSENLKLIQLDEIISGLSAGSFRTFFKETLPSFINQFEFIDEADKGAQLAVLGLGANGHVAFHEPGLDKDFFSGCVNLSADTILRNKLSAGTRAVSYGVGAFLLTQAIILIVRGEAKKNILRNILSAGCDLPAAQLMSHPNLVIITDIKI
ncbi:MAG: hypothetical protein A2Z20_11865 [Bdellovibrionales bacterium RBG_16_40_8]|nr:MAG: hypothetical protein A2Z20_11865 [Bdellovibrionales bacterium RBG_16_40_8]